jgi:hypothetical protein
MASTTHFSGRVDIVHGQFRVRQRAVHRLADQPGLADIGAPPRMVGLADADYAYMSSHVSDL